MDSIGHIKGIVAEIGDMGRVRVRLPEYDDLITDWLPVVQSATLGARTWAVPRVDTQVVVLAGLGLEDAVVLGAIYSQPDPPPFGDSAVIGMTADDDVSISYDPGASLLTITAPKLIKIIADDIDIEANIKLTGDRDIKGNLVLEGDQDIKGNLTLEGDQDVTGATTQTGDVTLTGNITQTGNLDQVGAITSPSATIAAITAGGGAVSMGAGGMTVGAVSVDAGGLTAPSATIADLEAAMATIGGIPFVTHKHVATGPSAPTGPAVP
jgi:phage baseplate assembly protein V